MGSASKYQRRAIQCAERALTVARAVDRARWLQLAEDWAALSRIPFPGASELRNEPAGLWRGELLKD